MPKPSKRLFESDLPFLESFDLTPREKNNFSEQRSKERKPGSKTLSKEEKEDVVCRLIHYFQTH
ncbi:MAG: hypothetical protein IT308_06715 [Anaerolineaceae bacterium]|nr:hypothetical protein [Anaerolineaceae bacterium]